MPLKTCPNCQAKCGVRTLKCKECGHDFKKERTSPPKAVRTSKRFRQLCGIGAWIKDTPKGMPTVSEPEPLSELPKKLPILDISQYIAYEGIGSCIIDLIPAQRIEDPVLSSMWDDAHKRLVEIISYVARREIETCTQADEDQQEDPL